MNDAAICPPVTNMCDSRAEPSIFSLEGGRSRVDSLHRSHLFGGRRPPSGSHRQLFNQNFRPLAVVARWRDPQLQVGGNYSDLSKWRPIVFKFCWCDWRRVGHRTERVNMFIMAVDPQRRYSNEAERVITKTFMMISNWKKTFGLHGSYKSTSAF